MIDHPMTRDRRTPFRPEHLGVMATLLPGFSSVTYHAARRPLWHRPDGVGARVRRARFVAHPMEHVRGAAARVAPLAARLHRADQAWPRRGASSHLDSLQSLRTNFVDLARGVLDELPSREVARRLLLSSCGPFATLGTQAGRSRQSVVDLAIRLRNHKFLHHRHVTSIIDDMWMGRSAEGGSVRLATLRAALEAVAADALSVHRRAHCQASGE